MIPLFALQLTLPLLLIAWVGLAPARGLVGFWIQVIASAAGLLAIALAGLWLFPPWWSPFAFACLWVVAGFLVALGALAVNQATHALSGRTPPQARIVDLGFPLGRGTYLVVNGGSDPSTNAHVMTLDTAVPRLR